MTSIIYKAQAKRLGAHLADKQGIRLKHSALLEAVAALHGCADWNTLASTGPAVSAALTALGDDAVICDAAPSLSFRADAPCVPMLADLRLPCAQEWLKQFTNRGPGLHLIVGPCGNGKTTTLLSTAQVLASLGRHALVITDLMEYAPAPRIDYLLDDPYGQDRSQWRVNIERQALRIDGDLVFLSEIRDAEGAALAQRLCFAGRTVIACMHANGPQGAAARLRYMGVEPLKGPAPLLKSVMRLDLARPDANDAKGVMEVQAKLDMGLSPRVAFATLYTEAMLLEQATET